MSRRPRLAFAALVALHGLVHLLGAGVAWVVVAVLLGATAVALAVRARFWWVLAGVAAAASQAMVLTSWQEAKAGTVVNVLLLLAAAYGFAAYGPRSFSAQYDARSRAAAASVPAAGRVVTEADLVGLPSPVADCVRAAGAVGRPPVTGFEATVRGRIRGGPDGAWMPFAGRQANTFEPTPTRFFLIEARRAGLPVWVFHAFSGHATMRARLLAALPVTQAAGPELDRAETVTLFNDLVLFAPAALVGAPVRWEPLDEHRVRGHYTAGGVTVSAEIAFDDQHRVVDFASDDRLRASADGRSFTPQRWSTPVTGHRVVDGLGSLASGKALWHAPQPEGGFCYLEVEVDQVAHLSSRPATAEQPAR